MRHPFRVRICIPFLIIASGSERNVHACCLVVTFEVAFDEVAFLEGVLDWIAVVAARQLDYLVKTNMVELASFIPVDPINRHDELAVTAPPAVHLAFPSLIVVLSLIHGSGLGLALVLAKDCPNVLLAGGMACREVEQLPHHPRLAASELMDKCFIGHAKDEHSDHVRIHDVGKLIALLGKAADILT
jgi:hypothetical protein